MRITFDRDSDTTYLAPIPQHTGDVPVPAATTTMAMTHDVRFPLLLGGMAMQGTVSLPRTRRPQNVRTLLKRLDRLEAWRGQHQDSAISIFGSRETATDAEPTVAWLQV